jgi:hypothetical protein
VRPSTARSSGSRWDQFRSSALRTATGLLVATQTIAGRTRKLLRQDTHVHMVAWTEIGTPYRVQDTLEDQLSNAVLLDLATSCRPVG